MKNGIQSKQELNEQFNRRNSIRYRLVMGLSAIVVPVIVIMIYSNFYSIRVVRNQVAESYKNMISLYMEQIDSGQNDVDKYLSNLIASNSDLQIMDFTYDQSKYHLAKMRLRTKVMEDILLYRPVSSMFFYHVSKRDFLQIDNADDSYSSSQDGIRDYIILECDGIAKHRIKLNGNWYVKKINQDYYLFRILKVDENYIGAWVSIKSLVVPLNKIDLGREGMSLLVTADGEPMMDKDKVEENHVVLIADMKDYYISGDKTSYLIVGKKSSKGNFSLMALIPDKQILENLPYYQWMIYMISAFLILMLPAFWLFLENVVIKPLRRMISAMKRIQEGNLDTRIEPGKSSEEFIVANNIFNDMMSQIKELKINVYEEKINRQKSELQHLQLQINPHFFLNSLNIICLMARSGKLLLIQEMTQCMIQYFRFMFKSNLTFIPLKEELKHVQNYIRIQELRLDKTLHFEIDCQYFLMNTPVPPLIIHTFIENSVKYAMPTGDSGFLTVQIELVDRGGRNPYVKILIRDTGKGFEDEVLKDLRAGNRIIDQHGEHIGIWNVMQRLRILYRDKAEIRIENGSPNGAIIEMLLPMEEDKLNMEAVKDEPADRG